MKRVFAFQLFLVVVMLAGCNLNITHSGPPVTLDSLSTFDYQKLLQLVEKEERLKDSIAKDDKNETTRFTIVMPDSDMALVICWNDTSRQVIKYMSMKSGVQRSDNWITRDSVSVGVPLAQLEKLNGAPVTINDLGFITSFGAGKLNTGIYSL